MSSGGLSPAEVARALESARGLERSGDLARALDWYKRLNASDDVVRVLAGQREFTAAAEYLLQQVPDRGATVSVLTGEHRRKVLNASMLLARAGDVREAVRLMLLLGERTRAAELLEKSGDVVGASRLREEHRPIARQQAPAPVLPPPSAPKAPKNAAALEPARRLEAQGNKQAAMEGYAHLGAPGEAARLASELGYHQRAAHLFLEAGKPYEASVCFYRAGDQAKALEAIQRVAPNHPNYRQVVSEAVRLALAVGSVGIAFEYFIGPFMASQPESDRDLETLYALAQLYDRMSLPQNALEAMQRVVAVSPRFRDAAAWVARLRRVDTEQLKAVHAENAQFNRASSPSGVVLLTEELPTVPGLPEPPPLPDLPPLPGLPPLPVAAQKKPAVAAPPAAVAPAELAHGDTAMMTRPPVEKKPPGDEQRVVAGRYRLEKRLGQGGMGEVFAAFDLELSDHIAIKLFLAPDDGAKAEAAVARFKQEAKLARRLVHENIVRLFDFGIDQSTHFITMELLAGHELRAEIGPPMDPARVVQVLRQSLAALGAAHAQGVIHRDIKPENLFITEAGVLKVMDFGIAKGKANHQLTQAGTMAGTPKYIAPEQINDFTSVTPAADQYALGIVAYEMLTGQTPFDHPELVPLLMMHVHTPPKPPRTLVPSIPPQLEAVVLKMIAKTAEQRFDSAASVLAALS